MKRLKDIIIESIFDDDSEKKLDQYVNFSHGIKKLTTKSLFERTVNDLVKSIKKDGAEKIKYMEPDKNYLRIVNAIDRDTGKSFILVNFFIYEGDHEWKNYILRYNPELYEPIGVNIVAKWRTEFMRIERNFIELAKIDIYTLPDNWIEFTKYIQEKYDRS